MKSYGKLKPPKLNYANLCTQLYYIVGRELKGFTRDPRPSRIRLGQTIVFALLCGLLYFDLPHDQQVTHGAAYFCYLFCFVLWLCVCVRKLCMYALYFRQTMSFCIKKKTALWQVGLLFAKKKKSTKTTMKNKTKKGFKRSFWCMFFLGSKLSNDRFNCYYFNISWAKIIVWERKKQWNVSNNHVMYTHTHTHTHIFSVLFSFLFFLWNLSDV